MIQQITSLLLGAFLLLASQSSFAVAGCPDVPSGGGQGIESWLVDRNSGAPVPTDGYVLANTILTWHGRAQAYGQCKVFGPSANGCVLISTQERTVNNIARSHVWPDGREFVVSPTFGMKPNGSTDFRNEIDTTAVGTTSGPPTVLIQPGTNVLKSRNNINTTICPIPPKQINAPDLTITGIAPRPRRTCPSGSGPSQTVFGNPCNAVSGTKTEVENDFTVGTVRYSRTYTSDAGHLDLGFGKGWAHPFLSRIFRSGDALVIERGDGTSEGFKRNLTTGAWAGVPTARYSVTSLSNGGYSVTVHAGGVETYSGGGLLESSQDLRGHVAQYFRDDQGRLTSVDLGAGRVVNLTYAENASQIATMTTPSGGVFRFEYENRLMTRTTFPDGSTRRYSYQMKAGGVALLTHVINESGFNYARWTYAPSGEVTSTTRIADAAGTEVGRHTFAHDSVNKRNTMTDPLGVSWTFGYSSWSGVPTDRLLTSKSNSYTAGDFTFAYSPGSDGAITLQKDQRGTQTCYRRQTGRMRLEIARVEGVPAGQTCSTSGALPSPARRFSTQWHPQFDLKTRYAEPGKVTTNVYHGQPDPFRANAVAACAPATALLPDGTPLPVLCKRVEQATTDALGAAGFAAPLQSGVTPRVSLWSYNSVGDVVSYTSPKGDTSTYAYYADTTSDHTQGDLASITNALGQTTTFTKYNRMGQLLESVDANGTYTRATFDQRQRISSSSVGSEVTTFTHDVKGQLVAVTRSDGQAVQLTYDEAYRLTGMRDQRGNRVTYTLDAAGNRVREDAFDPYGQLAQTRTSLMDPLSRLAQSVSARGYASTYAYDAMGNVNTEDDALGRRTAFGWDALNRLVSTVDAGNGTTSQSYDAQDRVTVVTAPNGATTRYTYDGLGNRTQEQSADRGTTNYSYDAVGNPLTITDARGATTNLAYDALNRLTGKAYQPGANAQATYPVQYGYDQGANGLGRLTSTAYESATESYSFDANGRPLNVARVVRSTSHLLGISYGYDAVGQLVSMTYPTGQVVNYQWSFGRISGLSVNGQTVMSQIAWHPNGEAQSWVWGNGVPHTRGFDGDGAMNRHDLDGGLRTLNIDAVGRIDAMQHSNNVMYSQGLGYDALNRLTNFASGTQSGTWSYDSAGNRLSSNVNAGPLTQNVIAAGSNRLVQVGGSPWSYDAAGNLLSDGQITHTYDAAGRRVTTTHPITGVSTHHYDAFGRRVEKQTSRGTMRFVYDPQGHMIGEYDYGANVTVQETVWLGDMPVAVLKNGQTYHVHTDHLNTPRAIKRASNHQTVWRWVGEPFGASPAQEDVDGDGIAFEYNLRFAGQYLDKETGLHQNWNRDYAPGVGRYTQSDPIGLNGGINTYAYIGNDPIHDTDQDGLKPRRPRPTFRPDPAVDAAGYHDIRGEIVCVEWNCPKSPDACFNSDTKTPNDFIPPAFNPVAAPPGCKCTRARFVNDWGPPNQANLERDLADAFNRHRDYNDFRGELWRRALDARQPLPIWYRIVR
jgi:RHS repeat-associated protein